MQKTRLTVISSLLLLAVFVPSAALAQTASPNGASASGATSTTTTTANPCPPVSAALGSIASVKLPATVCVVDSFGNVYSLTVSGTHSSYSIRGQLVTSTYLLNTPWNVYGNGKGASFSWLSTDPVSDNGDCNWRISATATPPIATGTWVNLGCGHESGTVTLAECTATACTTGTSDGTATFGKPGA